MQELLFAINCARLMEIAVITAELASKASFVYSCMQMKLTGQYNGK